MNQRTPETLDEKLSRVRMMSQDDGDTWDLSDNDKAALTAVVNILTTLGYYKGHTAACSMQHEWFCPQFCPVREHDREANRKAAEKAQEVWAAGIGRVRP